MLSAAGLSTKAQDCSVNEIDDHRVLLTNIDVFTPIHDDPYIMGKIAACNVTNDLFAMNATKILNYSAFLGLPKDIPEDFPVKMMQGQIDFLKSLGGNVHGGHTIYNPWPLLGGSASAIVEKASIKHKTGLQSNDHLILTKPLGIQAIMAAYRLRYQDPVLLDDFDPVVLDKHIGLAIKCMTTSNQAVSQTVQESGLLEKIHGMTDVTGFGFHTHLSEMLHESPLGANITTLPVIASAPQLSDLFGYQIDTGKGAETAGAMLIAIDSSVVNDFGRALSDRKVWWRDVGEITQLHSGIKFTEKFHLEEIQDY
jgi:selenide,water dikinase